MYAGMYSIFQHGTHIGVHTDMLSMGLHLFIPRHYTVFMEEHEFPFSCPKSHFLTEAEHNFTAWASKLLTGWPSLMDKCILQQTKLDYSFTSYEEKCRIGF